MKEHGIKTLITGALNVRADDIRSLEAIGLQVDILNDERDMVVDPSVYEIVICNALFQYQRIEEFTSLKLIQLTSAGTDRVPMEYIKDQGIKLFTARDVYSIPMAEFAICGLLQLYKRSHFFYDNQRSQKWEKHRGLLELSGKQVCIVGAGSVGKELAKRLSVFDVRVIGIDLYPTETSYFETVIGLDKLDEYLTASDIVALTLPLTQETHHLIDSKRLGLMKPGAILINIARGAIVDATALIESLRSNKLSGAVLDVFEEEPLPGDSPLWELDNVILTPHNSFVSDMIHRRLMSLILDNLGNPFSLVQK